MTPDQRTQLDAAIKREGNAGRFASSIGVSRQFLHQVLKGQRPASQKILRAINTGEQAHGR